MKTLLIILAFVVITILVFKPFHSCGNDSSTGNNGSNVDASSSNTEQERECYDAAFDSKYIDPRVNPYSKDIAFRPDTDIVYGLDDPMNNDPDKLFDYLSDQDRGVNEYDNTLDTDPRHNVINLRREFVKAREEQLGLMELDQELRQRARPGQGMRERVLAGIRKRENEQERMHRYRMARKPFTSSYTNTEIDEDIVNESNNIARYCANSQPDVGGMPDDKGSVLPDGVDRPYSAIIDDLSDAEMDMDNKAYYDLISNRPEQKTYIQIDDDFGQFNQNGGDGRVKDINGLADITKVMNVYRDNTLRSIRGGYRLNRDMTRINPRDQIGAESRGESDDRMYA